jgi:LacI family transcriptional regulator
VVVARHGGSDRYDSVVSDDYEGARLTVEHLMSLGHRRIAHTTQPSGQLRRPHVLSHTARLEGYREAMLAAGQEPDVIETSYSEEGGYTAARIALTRPKPPTAIFAGADNAAFGVLRAAEEMGLRIPEDLSVTGYDNIYASSIGRVSLTTVDQSGHHTGELSAQLLLDRIAGRARSVQEVLAPKLFARGTSGPAPTPRGARRSSV